MTSKMRNTGSETQQRSLDKNINHQIKSLAKMPSQSIFYKIIEMGNNRKEGMEYPSKTSDEIDEHRKKTTSLPNARNFIIARNETNKIKNENNPSFLFPRSVENKIKNQDMTLEKDNEKEVFVTVADTKISNNSSTIECNSEDSRITGGGFNKSINLKNLKHSSVDSFDSTEALSDKSVLSKRSSNNPSRKVSFKIRNPATHHHHLHKKLSGTNSVTITTLTSNNVALLTQKFNEMFKENNKGLLNDPKIAKAVGKLRNNNSHKSSESGNSTPNSTIGKNVSIKIITSNKPVIRRKQSLKNKSPSNTSLDNIESSPLPHRKVTRVRSDSTPKKKQQLKRKNRDVCRTVNVLSDITIPESTQIKSIHIDEILSSSVESQSSTLEKVTKTVSHIQIPGSVKAVVEKFESSKMAPCLNIDNNKSFIHTNEQKIVKSQNNIDNDSPSKPKIPEKKLHLSKTKHVVIRDGKPKIKHIKKNEIDDAKDNLTQINNDMLDCTETIKDTFKTDDNSTNCKNDLSESMKKDKLYDKYRLVQSFLHGTKLQLINFDSDIDADINETPKTENKSTNQETDEKDELIEHKKIYEDIKSNIIPNESFLWRSNSINDSTASELQETDKTDNLYDIVNPIIQTNSSDEKDKSTEDTEENFESFIKKADELLQCKKHEIVQEIQKTKSSSSPNISCEAVNLNVKTYSLEKINEAVNSSIVDKLEESNNSKTTIDVDEEYEPLEPYREESFKNSNNFTPLNTSSSSLQSHSKLNCPLPELPKSSTENIYQTLYDVKNSINSSGGHNYEYCHGKENKANDNNYDGYEYCTSPKENHHSIKTNSKMSNSPKNYSLLKSDSIASSMGYEKISSIYEKIPLEPEHNLEHENSSMDTYNALSSNYDECNCEENIYDTIKHSDTISVSNCYESIPGSPNSVLRAKNKPAIPYATKLINHNQIPFDTISTNSQLYNGSIVSSENKTNSIYGQRSIVSFGRSETIVYGETTSDVSSSDRSDDWIDMSDQDESSGDPTIIIVRERTKGRRSPVSWSRKVRDQWIKSPKKTQYDSDKDSSDEHLYESLSHPLPDIRDDGIASIDDFDSFDSDSENEQSFVRNGHIDIENVQLPEPPTSNNIYTLTKFASAAGKKMKQLKRNFTKSTRKKSDKEKSNPNLSLSTSKEIGQSLPYLNHKINESDIQKSKENLKSDRIYQNTIFPRIDLDDLNIIKAANDINGKIKAELELSLLNNKPSMSSPNDNNQNENSASKNEKRKNYLSFKSKFKRNLSTSDASLNSPPPLTVTNSKFYLNETFKDDSGNAASRIGDSLMGEAVNHTNGSPDPIPPLRKHHRKSTQSAIIEGSDISSLLDGESPRIKTLSKSVRRPTIAPPPPPPPENFVSTPDMRKQSISKKDKRSTSTTSWYAECGLFKATEPYKPETNGNNKERTSSTSWYAEVGLYQAGNISNSSGASSSLSGTGTCSTTTVPSPPLTPVPPLGMFNHEPLYQFYDAAKLESACRELVNESDSDGYEQIANFREGVALNKVLRPSAMTLVNPQKGPSRTLWCEIPEVKTSGILDALTSSQKKKQEALFEIITSEASYLNSLNVLESNFISHPSLQDENVLSKENKEMLFGQIIPVRQCSEALIVDLEACWQDNILLRGLCSIIKNHAEQNFQVYVKYCENQVYLLRTMKQLKSDPKFVELLNVLQSQSACQSLSLHSFLMLPMQRATRLPLLMDAVLKNLEASDDEYDACRDALATLNNIVSQCNEGTRNVERMEEMKTISSQIEFPSHIKEIPIIVNSNKTRKSLYAGEPQRWLVRSGELTQFIWRAEDQLKLTFGKKYNKVSLYFFLFTDLLLVTKKKSDKSYIVIDYCKRSLIEITTSDMMAQSPVKDSPGKNIILLTMLENHENKTVEMLLSCTSESDRQRWIEACSPPPSDNPNETIYEGWDCPQVTAIYPYESTQPDELNLQQGDIINVDKKMMDGWYYGERIRDGEKGWFPGNYTMEIASAHVRARNLRQRYRLLALSGSYLGQQKKK